MESSETYQRQVLSIFSIAMGISFLGVACMALYCRNKRLREKHRSNLAESRHLRDCSINASGLMSKSSPRPPSGPQPERCCKAYGSSLPQGGSPEPGCSAVCPPIQLGASPKGKRLRSGSLSVSPSQKRKSSHHWTPPIARSRHNLIGARDSGHAYRHLQEVEAPETEPSKRCKSQVEGDKERRHPSLNMQTGDLPAQPKGGWRGLAEVPCTRLDKGTASSSSVSHSSSTSTPASTSAISVPIISFVQGHSSSARGSVGEAICVPEPSNRGNVHLETDLGSADWPADVCTPVPETLLGSAAAAASHGHYHHALAIWPSEVSQGSGVASKHKSLVTYTTALGSGMGAAHVTTVVSAEPTAVPRPGGQSVQYSARLQPAGSSSMGPRRHGPARLQAPPHSTGDKKAGQGNGPHDSSVAAPQRGPLESVKARDGATPTVLTS